jgi:DNA-binding transcriptional regulator YhcF (GntR family)
MKKILSFFAFFVYTVILIILLNSNVIAADNGPRGPHPKIMEQLTEEQQKEVKARLKELWEEGASREEIRDTLHKMLEEYGVDFPERGKGFREERGPRPGRGFMKFADQLSEEQKNAIKEKVKTLREEGASREEIHTEVSALLKEYGIEVPEDGERFKGKRGHRPGRGWMHFSDELSDEQRKAIHEKVKSMKDDGASREEVHKQVVTMLKEYGVEIPDDFGKHRERWDNLSEDQRKQIRAKMRKMRKDGATREEIHEEVKKLFEEFGVKESETQSNLETETSGESLTVRAYPNPFNPETNIEYHLKSNALVAIQIYDVQGKKVRSLGGDYRQAGAYTIKWDGLNESGTQVPSGIYFIRISAGNETLNHRIVMMK